MPAPAVYAPPAKPDAVATQQKGGVQAPKVTKRQRIRPGYRQVAQIMAAEKGNARQLPTPLEPAQLTNGMQSTLAGSQAFLAQQAASSQAQALQIQNSLADKIADGKAADKGGIVGSGIEKFISAAKTQLGEPYVWGAAQKNQAFDCSGLTMWAAKKIGYTLPHSSVGQWNMLRKDWVNRKQLQPGDLMFFDYGTRNGAGPEHVGIYLGNNRILHAHSSSRPVEITSVDWGAFMNGARLNPRKR